MTKAKQILSVFMMYFIVLTGATYTLSFSLLLAWPVAVCYVVWVFCFDRQTFKRGGRRFEAVRRLPVFRHVRDYYPVRLIKTATLEPQLKYIFGYHPHGMIPEGLLVAFATEQLGFSEKFPGIVPYIGAHSMLGWSLPLRDIAMSFGVVDVSRDSLLHILTRTGPGHSVVIIIGGAREVLYTSPDTYILSLKNHKGFAKLALQTGSHLVPVFAFGQNDLFHQPLLPLRSYKRGSYSSIVLKWCGVMLKYTLMSLYGRFGLPVPWPTPINVVVGSPIPVHKIENPTESEVDHVHTAYVKRLTELFQENKDKYGVPQDTELIIK